MVYLHGNIVKACILLYCHNAITFICFTSQSTTNASQISTAVMKTHSASTLWVGTTVSASQVIQEMVPCVKVNYQKPWAVTCTVFGLDHVYLVMVNTNLLVYLEDDTVEH